MRQTRGTSDTNVSGRIETSAARRAAHTTSPILQSTKTVQCLVTPQRRLIPHEIHTQSVTNTTLELEQVLPDSHTHKHCYTAAAADEKFVFGVNVQDFSVICGRFAERR